jgi:DNA helicase-2/ATP-dependent DNA helicase PcrA
VRGDGEDVVKRPEYLLADLTEEQAQAVLHSGSPLLIIAGPGSGKTTVITWRVVHLVRSGQVAPENLLVVTFTNRAADQLKDRIQAQLPEVNVEAMQVSTIHAFCARLLREHADRSPLPSGYRILDSDAQFLFVYARRKALGLSDLVKGNEHAFFEKVVGLFNLATEDLVDPAKLKTWCLAQAAEADEDDIELWQERAIVADAYSHYEAMLIEEGVADFGHLQKYALELLQSEADVLEQVRAQFQELLVDEYQDTNAVQNELFGLIDGGRGRITVVGDDDQSIYRFRGATVDYLLNFKARFPGAADVRLEENFRSISPIVKGSTEVIQHNPSRFEKDLHSHRGLKPANEVLLVYEHTVAEEAEAAVDFLARLKTSGRLQSYGDAAVLLRSVKSYAEPCLAAMRAAGIPYHVIGDASFFDRPEIADLYHLFSFLSTSKNWGDRFLRSDLVGFSDPTNEVLKGYKGPLSGVDFEAGATEFGVDDQADWEKLRRLHALKRRVQAKEHRSLLAVLYRLLAITGCVQRFESAGDAEALSNLAVMTQLVANWDRYGNSRNFYPFQKYLKLLKQGGVDPVLVPPPEAVQVMTIHQAKGLEFPLVVLGAAMKGRLPSRARKEHYQVPYELRMSGEPSEQGDLHMIDERRLFYVAATRARDLLIVGTADVVNKRGGGPSPYVYEMFGDDLEEAARASEDKVEAIEAGAAEPVEARGRYNFSQLAYYLQCPMRYKFGEVYGFQAPWLDPVDFGSNVHRALDVIHERVLAGDPPDLDEVEAIVKENWSSGSYFEGELLEQYQQAAVKQIGDYLSGHAEELERVVASEGTIATEIGAHLIGGKYDLLRAVEGDSVEVVDFKTSDAVDLAGEGIDLQLALYARGVQDGLERPVARGVAHFLRDGEVVRVAWSEALWEKARGQLGETLESIDAEAYPPNDRYCARCSEYQAICPHSVVEPKVEES